MSSHDHLTATIASAFLAGQLTVEERGRVESAVDECDVCRRSVAVLVAAEPPSSIGRYQLRGVVGRGAMGVVYRAWDPQLEREVAVKVLREDSAEARQRMVREARAMARVTHSSILSIFDADLQGDQVALVTELVDGEDLGSWFATAPPWREVIRRCALAGAGLTAAHEAGLIHRDVKPTNILCARDGRVLVADFGVVRRDPVGGIDVTRTGGTLVGTPAYMAPEQLLGHDVDARADQFALAVVMFEGMFGARPFPAVHLGELIAQVTSGAIAVPARRDVPASIVAVLRRALAKDRDARWPSIAAMIEAFELGPRRSRSVRPIALGLLAVVALGGGIVLWELREPEEHAPAPVPAPAPAPPKVIAPAPSKPACRQLGPHAKGTFRKWTFDATYDTCTKDALGTAMSVNGVANATMQIGGRAMNVAYTGALPYDGPLAAAWDMGPPTAPRPALQIAVMPPELAAAPQPACVNTVGKFSGQAAALPADLGHVHFAQVGDRFELTVKGSLLCTADNKWYPIDLAMDGPFTAR